MLSQEDMQFYKKNGYLIVEDAVSSTQLDTLRALTAEFIDASRNVRESNVVYDLDKGHAPDSPRLTRIKIPHKQHPYFWEVLQNSRMTEVLASLLGPDTAIITSKLNTKAPGGGAAVEWHQDWAFYPHTNDDLLAFGLMLAVSPLDTTTFGFVTISMPVFSCSALSAMAKSAADRMAEDALMVVTSRTGTVVSLFS